MRDREPLEVRSLAPQTSMKSLAWPASSRFMSRTRIPVTIPDP